MKADLSTIGNRKATDMNITTTRNLLTDAWTADVSDMEQAIQHFTADRRLTDDCHVAFFEIARDPHLHVNVTHTHPTAQVSGWAGPGDRPEGFVHNRRFVDTATVQIVRHIREMVFAAPL
jgi:hypothetical protein